MSESAFGLYGAPACAPGQKLAAGAGLDLVTPVASQGTTLFRRSLWLPIPAAARQAQALELTGSSLALRFAPVDFPVQTGNEDWFERASTDGNQTVRLEFKWPAPVRRIHAPAGFSVAFELFRVDGQQVAGEPTQSGQTGAALNPPWVGSPLEIKLAHPIFPRFKGERTGISQNFRAKARAAGGGASPVSQVESPVGEVHAFIHLVNQSEVVPSLTIAGRPASPRLKLFLESPGEERLLWQSLVPGDQGSPVTLPPKPVAEEWAAALEQVVKALGADPGSGGARLRLDLESDAPCALSLQQASLSLLARFELAATPARLDFDGSQSRRQALDLGPLPAGTPRSLNLRARLEGGEGAAPGPAGTAPRRGLLLEADRAVVIQVPLAAATALAGLGLLWHPLSDGIKGQLEILADGGTGPGRVLLKTALALDTPAPGWLALRWPALDLQAQSLWLRLGLEAGMGLWLAEGEGPPPAGWQAALAAGAGQTPLGLAPAYRWLEDGAGPSGGEPRFQLGVEDLPASRDGAYVSAEVPTALLPQLGSAPLAVVAATPARLTLEAVALTTQL